MPDPTPVAVPRPLRPGDRIGVTAPSSGVQPALRPRLDAAVRSLERRGYEVVLGACLGTPSHVSAPAAARADELMAMLVDPDIAAVVPPWGGETGIDLLPLLDYDLLRGCDPCWYVGFSDTSTTMLPLTLVSGWATLHGWNLMDTPYAPAPGLLHWLDVATAEPGTVLRQTAATHRATRWADYEGDPEVSELVLDVPTRWSLLDAGMGDVTATGRLVGGCLEVLSPLAGTAYGDVPAFNRESGAAGTVVFLEVAEEGPYAVARMLHGLRLAGWFADAAAVLVGRTPAPDADGWTQHDAVREALGGLDVPVVLDVDFGHQQPLMPFVVGLEAIVTVTADAHSIAQRLPSEPSAGES